ncbi:MAG: N-6 DNA methylase [Bdellovibrionales bacterium]|nr:N-6 DNA methylase [Bdellovibrionales bacterium]
MYKQASAAQKLATLLESDYAGKSSNAHGVVFTPQNAAQHLVSGLELSESPLEELRILDPACGSGILLCAVLKSLIAQKKINTASDAAIFLERSLYGIDRDPRALQISRLSMLLTLIEALPHNTEEHVKYFSRWKRNFYCGDFLAIRDDDLTSSFDSLSHSELPHFTHIIANPPYGLSRDDQIAPALLKHYKKHYQSVLAGKPNKYLLFFARSLELLATNGKLSFLIPNSWLGIVSATKIRKILLQQGFLRTIDIVEDRSFVDRGVETVFVTAQKSSLPNFSLQRFHSANAPRAISRISLQNREVLDSSTQAIIPLYPSTKSAELWRTVSENSIPLHLSGLPITPRIALQVYATGKGCPPQTKEIVRAHSFHELVKSSEGSLPYLEGSDVKRFSISWSGSYLRYGEWVAEFQPIARYTGPRILIREVLGKSPNLFIAAYTEEQFLYNRSILHCIPSRYDENSRDLFHGLTALFNSHLASFFLTVQGRKASRRLFPKIVLDDLKFFPIPKEGGKALKKLSLLIDKESGQLKAGKEDELQAQVAELYGVTPTAIGEELK